jgi:hypothetical protein
MNRTVAERSNRSRCRSGDCRSIKEVGSPASLLAKAERKLRAGKVSEAMNLFEEIVDGHVPSLEQLAALAYLRTSQRKPPRRVR